MITPGKARAIFPYSTVLRNKKYIAVLVAGLASLWGDIVYDMAIMWMVLQLTGSTLAMGLIGAAERLPNIVAAPIAGVIADRFDRVRVMVVSDLIRTLVVGGILLIYVSGSMRLWVLVLSGVVLATAGRAFMPAQQALIPSLVGQDDLMTANSFSSMAFNSLSLAAKATAGTLIAFIGLSGAIAFNSVSFLISAIIIGAAVRRQPTAVSAFNNASWWRQIKEGFAIVFKSRFLRLVMVFAMIVNGVGGGVIITLPAAYSDRVIRAGVSGYGYLEAAFLAGAMIGAFLLGQIHPPARLAGRYLLTGLCAAALLLILFGMNRWLWSAILLWAAVSIAIAIANVPLMTMIQSVVPNHLRGRVFSIVFLVTGLLDPLSLAGAGAVADKIGVQATFITAGLILLVAGGTGWLFPEFRDTATGALDSTLSSSVT